MRKLVALVAVTLLLVGCSDARVQVSSNETLLTVNGQKVTEQDLFNVMKLSDAGSSVISHSSKVLTKDVKDASIDEKVADQMKQVKEYFELLNQNFDDYLKSLGYETEQQYIDEQLYPQYALNFLVEEKVEADYATLATEYKPVKARILQTSTIANANDALERIKNGESFDDVSKDLVADQATYKGDTTVYSIKDTQFPAVVSTFITTQTSPGLSTVLTTEGSEISYVVEIIETQADRIKDEAIDMLLANNTLTQTYIAKLYKENGFKVYDRDILTSLQTNYADYLSQ